MQADTNKTATCGCGTPTGLTLHCAAFFTARNSHEYPSLHLDSAAFIQRRDVPPGAGENTLFEKRHHPCLHENHRRQYRLCRRKRSLRLRDAERLFHPRAGSRRAPDRCGQRRHRQPGRWPLRALWRGAGRHDLAGERPAVQHRGAARQPRMGGRFRRWQHGDALPRPG